MKLTRNTIFILLFVASILLNGYYFLRSFPIRTGGGSYKPAPNNAFVAHAQSYVNKNQLAENYKVVEGELEIRSAAGDKIIWVAVTPPGIDNEMGYRMLDDPISWSTDSATASFDLPHAVISITPKTGQATAAKIR